MQLVMEIEFQTRLLFDEANENGFEKETTNLRKCSSSLYMKSLDGGDCIVFNGDLEDSSIKIDLTLR